MAVSGQRPTDSVRYLCLPWLCTRINRSRPEDPAGIAQTLARWEEGKAIALDTLPLKSKVCRIHCSFSHTTPARPCTILQIPQPSTQTAAKL